MPVGYCNKHGSFRDSLGCPKCEAERLAASTCCLVRICWCENCGFVATCGPDFVEDSECPECGPDCGCQLHSGDELPEDIYDVDPRPTFPPDNK